MYKSNIVFNICSDHLAHQKFSLFREQIIFFFVSIFCMETLRISISSLFAGNIVLSTKQKMDHLHSSSYLKQIIKLLCFTSP